MNYVFVIYKIYIHWIEFSKGQKKWGFIRYLFIKYLIVAREDVEKGEPFRTVGGNADWCSCCALVWRYLKKLKMDLTFDPVILLLEIHQKEPKTLIRKNISTPLVIAALFTIAEMWKQPEGPSVDEWIPQLWGIYTMQFYSAVKKKILPLVTAWMYLENFMLSEISQSEKDKYHLISLICRI